MSCEGCGRFVITGNNSAKVVGLSDTSLVLCQVLLGGSACAQQHAIDISITTRVVAVPLRPVAAQQAKKTC